LQKSYSRNLCYSSDQTICWSRYTYFDI
jgi:hypothetical protein